MKVCCLFSKVKYLFIGEIKGNLKNVINLFGVFCTEHDLSTFFKIGLTVVYYVTIVFNEEKKVLDILWY
jgi:hypothetical protein